MQDQPDQPTLSMGNHPDGLIVSQVRDRAAIDNLEDTSLGPGCGVGGLIEKAPAFGGYPSETGDCSSRPHSPRRRGKPPPTRRAASQKETSLRRDRLRQ